MKPFEYHTQPPILQVAPDDKRMEAAVAEARRRFPEFVAAFEHRKDDGGFYVKSEFVDGGDSEFMWLKVTSIEGGFVNGRLDNDPATVKNVHADQAVRVEVSSLNDWMYTKDGESVGGFTVKVLGEIENEEP